MLSLMYIAAQYTVYVGVFLFLIGVFGNSMLILIFVSEQSYRTTPWTFYFLIASVHDLLLVLFLLSTRILAIGFSIDLTGLSVVWCKCRYYLFSVWGGISLTCQCLATIDQFLVTSKNARIRRLSTLKTAHRTAVSVAAFWWLFSIPWLIWQDLSPVSSPCVSTTANFYLYGLFYALLILGILPMMFMAIFGLLAYDNIFGSMALHHQKAHRQTTVTVCMQVSLFAFSGTFVSAWYIYAFATFGKTNDAELLIKEYLAQSIIFLFPYVVTAVSSSYRWNRGRARQPLLFLCSRRDDSIYSWSRQVAFVEWRKGGFVAKGAVIESFLTRLYLGHG